MNDVSLRDRRLRLAESVPAPPLALLPALRHAEQRGEITAGVVALLAAVCQVEEEAVRHFFAAYPNLAGSGQATAVCGDLSCWLRGADRVFAHPEACGLAPGTFQRSSCLGYCFAGPVLRERSGRVRQVSVP